VSMTSNSANESEEGGIKSKEGRLDAQEWEGEKRDVYTRSEKQFSH